eukprot:10324378-Alexandrium_andersonii.AAC.1
MEYFFNDPQIAEESTSSDTATTFRMNFGTLGALTSTRSCCRPSSTVASRSSSLGPRMQWLAMSRLDRTTSSTRRAQHSPRP